MKTYLLLKKQYEKTEKLVITILAENYGPDRSGQVNASYAIQKALDDCCELGGGVVYLPEGLYRLEKPLTIPKAVTLAGDWENPRTGHVERGTVLLCCYGRNTDEKAQILMESCSGLKGMILYYPEQDIRNPVPYAPTIRQQGVDSVTVEYVTLVNPYIGIQCGPDSNELHFLKDVYLSPLSVGVYMDITTDIGRMQNLHISPFYYQEYEKRRSSSELSAAEMIEEYIHRHADGIFMARSDWEYGHKIYIEGCNRGLVITSMTDSGPNTQISELHIYNCQTGIQLINGNPYGIALSKGSICAEKGKMQTAIASTPGFDSVLQCNSFVLEGAEEYLVNHQGSGQLSFYDSYFRGTQEKPDVCQSGGGLTLLNCQFESGKNHIKIRKGSSGTQVIGSGTPEGIVDVSNEGDTELVLLREEQPKIPKLPPILYESYPYEAQAEGDAIYVVTDFGAAGDGKKDDTEAFQNALKTAGNTGGIVYVPAGWYQIKASLSIPEGVELRGVFEVPCHTMGGGSVLQACFGKGDEQGEPLLILEGFCGVRGLVIHYPEQDAVNPVEYPWAVQGRGKRCYAINTVLVNAWLGINFGTYPCEEHYISYVSGAPIRCGVFLGNNQKRGWVENVQFNPHYWYRCDLPGRPEGETWRDFWHNQIAHLDALVFGYNEQEYVLNTFVFAAKRGIFLHDYQGRGTSGIFLGHGTDGGEKGAWIDGCGEADFINTELVTIEAPKGRIYLYVKDTKEGIVRFHNTLMWGNPNKAIVIEEGTVFLNQVNFVRHGESAVTVSGGRTQLSAGYFYEAQKQINSLGGELSCIANMTVKEHSESETMSVISNRGSLKSKWNWTK